MNGIPVRDIETLGHPNRVKSVTNWRNTVHRNDDFECLDRWYRRARSVVGKRLRKGLRTTGHGKWLKRRKGEGNFYILREVFLGKDHKTNQRREKKDIYEGPGIIKDGNEEGGESIISKDSIVGRESSTNKLLIRRDKRTEAPRRGTVKVLSWLLDERGKGLTRGVEERHRTN